MALEHAGFATAFAAALLLGGCSAPAELDEPLAYLRRAILNLARNRRRGLARSRRTLQRIDHPASHTDRKAALK